MDRERVKRALQDLNYNSWPRSSNESLANEVGARLTQMVSCTTAENLTSTSFYEHGRGVMRGTRQQLNLERMILISYNRFMYKSLHQIFLCFKFTFSSAHDMHRCCMLNRSQI